MTILLEHSEIDGLLREGLKGRGIIVPPEARMAIRRNNTNNTIKVVFITPAQTPAT